MLSMPFDPNFLSAIFWSLAYHPLISSSLITDHLVSPEHVISSSLLALPLVVSLLVCGVTALPTFQWLLRTGWPITLF